MSVSNTNKQVKEILRKIRRKFSSEEKIRIVLSLNPGFEQEDKAIFQDEGCRTLLFDQMEGESDFPLWFNRWKKWFLPRVRIGNMTDEQIAIKYLHKVLIPQAKRGERFIVVCRAAWAWKIDRTMESENIKFVNNPRGGHFGPEIREQIECWLKLRQAKNT